MNRKVLIIDDNSKLASSLSRNFILRNVASDHAVDMASSQVLLDKNEYAVILLDLRLGEDSGLDVMRSIRQRGISTPVVIITGNATVDSAITALRTGVVDYIRKPVAFSKLMKICERYLADPKDVAKTEPSGSDDLLREAKKIAMSDLPVLITGESGTGKEILADYIHNHSRRSAKKMLKQNCASLPGSLLEDELFGHVRGAYTGAERSFKGIFERAHESSLFLDEIGEMPLDQQSKILRVLQDREIRRIGGETHIQIDVRFIAATNRPPEDLLSERRLREDLYYRLNGGHIHLRPLRDRVDEIPGLVRLFYEEFQAEGSMEAPCLTDEALEALLGYSWPGNIRELKNVIRYACAMSEGPQLTVKDLPKQFRGAPAPDQRLFFGAETEQSTLAQNERELIIQTLSKTRYNKSRTAACLSISRTTLYDKIRKYGIEV